MDLERIKQNLRLRSGRTKKPPKKSQPQYPPSAYQNTRTAEPSRPSTAAQPNGRSATPQSFFQRTFRRNSETSLRKSGKGTDTPQTKPAEVARQEISSPQEENTVEITEAQDATRPFSREDVRSREGVGEGNRPMSQESTPLETSRATPDPYSLNVDVGTSSEAEDFDLRPPPANPKAMSMESTLEILFSEGHLNTIIYSSSHLPNFSAFLQKYKPREYKILMQYLETSKAIKAVEYANAVAEMAHASDKEADGNVVETSSVAATLDTTFKDAARAAFDTLLNTSLPFYITCALVRPISDCLVDEITGRASPLTSGMLGGLSEVFCLSDPNQKDNPIIYASEEFFRLTGYGSDDVIGHNCRFLQGPKTNPQTPKRIGQSLKQGEESYETLLNYKRNGRPFVNVLMVAPLFDDKGNIKYHIGAQIDVSRFIESGNVLDSFQQHLRKLDTSKDSGANVANNNEESRKQNKRKALDKLKELSELFDLEETAVVQSHNRGSSLEREEDTRSVASLNGRRRLIGSDMSDDDDDDESLAEGGDWRLGQAGPSGLSGKLPGIYEKYMLIRPSPSLRVVFVSPKLRKFGNIVQSPFLSHVAAPAITLSGLAESFSSGTPVSAKINFMPDRTQRRDGTRLSPSDKHEDGKFGRACWMSATPLLGGDKRIGVWVIVFVEKAQAKARRAKTSQAQLFAVPKHRTEGPRQTTRIDEFLERKSPASPANIGSPKSVEKHYDLPIKAKRLDDVAGHTPRRQDAQRPSTAYRYQAADPVEEYRSPDETSRATSPIMSSPRPRTAPHMFSQDTVQAEEFVQPSPSSFNSPSAPRLRIKPDSERNFQPSVRMPYESREYLTAGEEQEDEHDDEQEDDYQDNGGEQHQDPNRIAPSVPSDVDPISDENDLSLDESTVLRSLSPDTPQEYGLNSTDTLRQQKSSRITSPDRSPSPEDRPSRPTSAHSYSMRTSRNRVSLPGGLGYMDYLRHSGSNAHTSPDAIKNRRNLQQDSEGEPSSETEGCRSPYSVD